MLMTIGYCFDCDTPLTGASAIELHQEETDHTNISTTTLDVNGEVPF